MKIDTLLALSTTILCMPAALRAQDHAASLSGSVSAFNMDSRTSVAYTAAFDYRFTRVAGLEVEGAFVPSLDSPFPTGVPVPLANGGLVFPIRPIALRHESGRAVFWSNNVRVAIPTTTTRVEPFFVAGGGVASLRHTAVYGVPYPIAVPDIPGLAGAATLVSPNYTYPVTSSSIGLALTLGGGVGVRTAAHLWIDADLRLIRILGADDKNAGRFGVAARYRF